MSRGGDAQFDIMFDSGISRMGDLIELATKLNLIEKLGAGLRYGNVQLGQGRENAKAFLQDNEDLIQEITRKILDLSGFSGKKEAVGKTGERLAAAAEDKGDGRSEAKAEGKEKAEALVSKSAPVAKPGLKKKPAGARA